MKLKFFALAMVILLGCKQESLPTPQEVKAPTPEECRCGIVDSITTAVQYVWYGQDHQGNLTTTLKGVRNPFMDLRNLCSGNTKRISGNPHLPNKEIQPEFYLPHGYFQQLEGIGENWQPTYYPEYLLFKKGDTVCMTKIYFRTTTEEIAW
jgi:hypothetical protein